MYMEDPGIIFENTFKLLNLSSSPKSNRIGRFDKDFYHESFEPEPNRAITSRIKTIINQSFDTRDVKKHLITSKEEMLNIIAKYRFSKVEFDNIVLEIYDALSKQEN